MGWKELCREYGVDFFQENMMGPNSMRILEELIQKIPLQKGMRVLDLGCGRGLTSIYLAKEFGVEVFATDLWIPASENHQRFCQMGVAERIVPIHADALDLPYADRFFDAVVSVDSYHYFGNNDTYFTEKLGPLLKKDAWVAIAFPGMKYEVHDNIPEEMKPFWEPEALACWHSIEWWRPKFAEKLRDFRIWEMNCFDTAWEDWLQTENPYAISDRPMIAADHGRFMNLIALTGQMK